MLYRVLGQWQYGQERWFGGCEKGTGCHHICTIHYLNYAVSLCFQRGNGKIGKGLG
jgi:hypothetical protein